MNSLIQLCKTLIKAVGPDVIAAAGTGLQSAIEAFLKHPPTQPPTAEMVQNLMAHVTLSKDGLKPEVIEIKNQIGEHILAEPASVTK